MERMRGYGLLTELKSCSVSLERNLSFSLIDLLLDNSKTVRMKASNYALTAEIGGPWEHALKGLT